MGKFVISAFADEIDNTLKVQMDVVELFGVSHIEMRNVNSKGLVFHTLDEVKEIKRQLDDRGFRLSAVGSPIGKYGIDEPFEPHLDLFKHTLEIAHLLEAPYIRMFSFWMPKGEDPGKYRGAVLDRWGQFVEAARGSGIILAHENEKGIYGDTAERCLDLLASLNCDYVKAVFDPANFVQCDEETYPKAWNMLKDFVAYMHIKDANYEGRGVVPSGHGDGKVKEILSELAAMEGTYFLSLEPHLGGYKGPAALEPESVGDSLPEWRQRMFALAHQELKRIIDEIGV